MELRNLSSDMASARSSMSHAAFEQSAVSLGVHRNQIREAFQARTSAEVLDMIDRLTSGQELSEADVEVARGWIVGDADSYLRQENNFEDWTAEFARLEGVLAGYEGRPLTDGDLLALKGIMEDALRVAHDIANYLEKRDRLKRFDAMIEDHGDWTREEREVLAHLLRGKLGSGNR